MGTTLVHHETSPAETSPAEARAAEGSPRWGGFRRGAGRTEGPGGVRTAARAPWHPNAGSIYLPPGWPERVRPPESADWEQSAVAFLLDCCPADYRAHGVLRRHPVVLASLAGQFVESQIRASREALARTRADLGSHVSNDVLDDTIEVLQVEEARLVRVRRAVALVEEALRGRVFIRRL